MKILKFLLKPWVIIALIIILAGGGYFVYRSAQSKKSTTTYKTATVTKGTLTAIVSGTGNLIVEKSASVNPSISGDVKNLAVKVGDTVKKGQTLFKITNDDLDLTVSKTYASLLQAQQSLTDSQNKLATDQTAQGTIDNDSKSTDSQKTDAAQKVASDVMSIQVAEINVQSARSSHDIAQKTAAKRTVTAPISGTITTLNISNGDTLGSSSSASSSSATSSSSSATSTGSSSTPIIISDLSSIQASVSLNEVDAASVKTGQVVSMTFDAVDGLTSTGKIVSVSTSGTETSGVVTYPAVISFDSLDSRLKPQMSVSATITTDIKQDVLYVPNSAVKSNDTSSYVLLMKDGNPSNQTVTVGIANDSYTEVVSGLNEGDTVVTQTVTASTGTSSATNTNRSGSSASSLGGLTGGGTPPVGGPGM
jgi:multidrug efflux pump subunit AcrA (membrane-fusion protein)